MISFTRFEYSTKVDGQPVYYGEGACVSTDTKPEGMANGSVLVEMDTGKVYMYDAAGRQWRVLE